ncbi:MAG: HEAT repeat domain-containing protein, partial [Armatimonadetes bacterium]|nr:HEAT repeat domain-containing protein [Armatimonadota bacterium]
MHTSLWTAPALTTGMLVTGLLMMSAGRFARAEDEVPWPVHAFCGTGDQLWNPHADPVDSPEVIDEVFEWLHDTYGAKRVYWRGAQGDIWDRHYQIGEVKPLQHDWAVGWKRYLSRKVHIHQAAVATAHRRSMEIYAYTGLFEHGVQPDVGIVCPYPFEDRLRIRHPEWCPVDRWGERRCPGPLCFAYPEVRRTLVDRYVDYVTKKAYDGLTFYTYVENVGLRYPDEFGFNEPIAAEFAKLHPGVDLRRDTLTDEQKLDWYRCRGMFVTEFLRELHARLSARGKALEVILDSRNPDYAQPWWGKPTPGTGMIRMEWETWISEGIVDGLWVQMGAMTDQQALLDRLLAVCAGTPVKLVVRTPEPFHSSWRLYVAAGVTPLETITYPRNGIRRLSLRPTSAETLASDDWLLRAQTLQDVADGALRVSVSAVAASAGDEHVLVRHRAMRALGTLGGEEAVAILLEGLKDPQSCVRIAATLALGKAGGAEVVPALLAAVADGGRFQLKEACVKALEVIGPDALHMVVGGLGQRSVGVREVCVRALYKLGRQDLAGEVFAPLRERMTDSGEDAAVRYWAIDGLVGLRLKVSVDRQRQLAADLRRLVESESDLTVQLHAAWGLGYLAAVLEGDERRSCVDALAAMFREYGDGCERADAAYGWRVVGNALLLTPEGREALEQMRQRRDDKWLAWAAYQVVYVPQRVCKMNLVSEEEA